MGKFTKVTTGHVVQYFEPGLSGKFICVRQEFLTDDLCEYLDDGGKPVNPPGYEYQPYNMVVKKSELLGD